MVGGFSMISLSNWLSSMFLVSSFRSSFILGALMLFFIFMLIFRLLVLLS